jgi:hypothetical protein
VSGPVAHRIDALVFDLAVADAASALADAALLAQQVRAHLLDAVAEACETVSAEAGTCRAEMLEIDLGTIGEPVDWPALREAFTHRLRAAMLQHVPMEARLSRGAGPDGRALPERKPEKVVDRRAPQPGPGGRRAGDAGGEDRAKAGAAASAFGHGPCGPGESVAARASSAPDRPEHPPVAALRDAASVSPPAAGAGRSRPEDRAPGFREEGAPWHGTARAAAAGQAGPGWPGLAEALVRLLCRRASAEAVEPVVQAVERAAAPAPDRNPLEAESPAADGQMAGAEVRAPDGPRATADAAGAHPARSGHRRGRGRRGRRGGTAEAVAAPGETPCPDAACGRAGSIGNGTGRPAQALLAGKQGDAAPATAGDQAFRAAQASAPRQADLRETGAGGGTSAGMAASAPALRGLNEGDQRVRPQDALRASDDAPRDARRASALKTLWAKDRDAVRAALDGRSAEELVALAEALLGGCDLGGRDGPGAPLLAACARLAAQPDGAGALEAIIAGILSDSEIDLAAILGRDAERDRRVARRPRPRPCRLRPAAAPRRPGRPAPSRRPRVVEGRS